jgi:DNA-binding NtrC family response regulator
MTGVMVVEDDLDIQFLIETVFSLDPRFSLAGVAAAAEDALEMARTTMPDIFVLDHALAGELTGVAAAPQIKEVAPHSRIILFTAHAELREEVAHQHAIDAFLLKTDSVQLLPLAQQLASMHPFSADRWAEEPPR